MEEIRSTNTSNAKTMKRTKFHKLKQLVILTNDPSFTAWGFAVVTGHGETIFNGCIKTQPSTKKQRIRKGDDRIRRINEINTVLLDIISKYKVNYIVSELPHGSQNASAAIMIGATAGIIQTLSDCLGIPVDWYSEADAKNNLLNKKAATKKDTIDAICQIYDIPLPKAKYQQEAICDAMAVFHVASKESSFIKFYKNQKL